VLPDTEVILCASVVVVVELLLPPTIEFSKAGYREAAKKVGSGEEVWNLVADLRGCFGLLGVTGCC